VSQRRAPEADNIGTPEEIAYEARAQEGAIWTGGRLLIGIFAFVFASLAFAYFYLRSSNNADLWRPGGVSAPTGIGSAIMVVTVVSAALYLYGLSRLRKNLVIDWMVAGWLAVAGILVALALQIWELTDLSFFPGSSGYASCFIGWGALDIVILLSGLYWMETLLARHLRLRAAVRQEGGATERTATLVPRMFRVNAETCGQFMCFVGLVSVLFWLLFYVV
jgi:hypothetical protein